MATVLYTVNDLVTGVRSLADELNTDSVDTSTDILTALNRAQQYGFDVVARKYPEPLLTHQVLTLVGGANEYSIPENAFEDRLLKVEIFIPSGATGTYREVSRISYRDISNYESSIVTNIPIYYCVIGRKIRFVSTPSGTYSARIWYLQEPNKLVLPQGRITHINPAAPYVIVDTLGPDVSTESDDLLSYVNIIDGGTGEVKGTLQVLSIVDNKVSFRTIPQRTTVLGRTVSGALPITIEADDYLSGVEGSCVPPIGSPFTNFLIEYAYAEMTTKLGGDEAGARAVLAKLETQLERMWVGREKQMRVQKKSEKWGTNTRRWWYE